MKITITQLLFHILETHKEIDIVPEEMEKNHHFSTFIVNDKNFQNFLWCNPTHLRYAALPLDVFLRRFQ